MGTVISFSIQKGGVAKTTSCVETAAILGSRGSKVLVVDMDGQSSLTQVTMEEMPDETIMDVLSDECSIKDAVYHLKYFDLVCGDERMYQVELMEDASVYELRNHLREIRAEYDYIIVDAPPSLGKLQYNCIVAADYLMIPVGADVQSYFSLRKLLTDLESIRKQSAPDLEVLGVFLTQYESRNKITKEMTEVMVSEFPDLMMESKIRRSVKVCEAQGNLTPLIEYAPKHNQTKDYETLVDEMLQRMKRGGE